MENRLYPSVRKITNAFCLVIVLLTAVLFTLRLTAFNGMLKEKAEPEPEPEQTIVDGVTLNYRIRTTIDFPSPGEAGNITIENDAENDFFLRLEIIYDISGRSVYLSPFLEPGAEIESARLQGNLFAPGEYGCTAVITAYDPETRTELQSHRQPVTIKIGQADVS